MSVRLTRTGTGYRAGGLCGLQNSDALASSSKCRYSTFPSRTVSPVITWPDGKDTLATTRNAAQLA